jgi:predicted unusual protein kinase regulating ubiquinone biosynthesis (AarF/ABC1/UbiB family)
MGWQRSLEIWGFIVKFLFKRWWCDSKWAYGKEGVTEAAKKVKIAALAVWLRENLVSLGPTFIKAGQQVRAQGSSTES